MRLLGAILGVDGNTPARVGFEAGFIEAQLVDVALAAHREQQRVARHLLLAFEVRDHAALGGFLDA